MALHPISRQEGRGDAHQDDGREEREKDTERQDDRKTLDETSPQTDQDDRRDKGGHVPIADTWPGSAE